MIRFFRSRDRRSASFNDAMHANSRDSHHPSPYCDLGEPDQGHDNDEQEEEDEDEDNIHDTEQGLEADPLLPIFSAAHLDSIPVGSLIQTMQALIEDHCETTLSWEQLRTPQVSNFLVKPVQARIQSSHFSRATLYALLAACLGFHREGESNPGNLGVCRTRAMMAELLAMRLLKDYEVKELIDALSFDFNPLTGLSRTRHVGSGSRTSTLEVAIRAQSKRFLAHPLVVQHLEAVWDGTVIFHAPQDRLHRYPSRPPMNHGRHFGAMQRSQPLPANLTSDETGTASNKNGLEPRRMIRRAASVYNPGSASLFKLSRLRVPRYRQMFSTISYAFLLGLFLAVLIQRSSDVGALEICFLLWSFGFMLDDIVGFSEQGFSLYLSSMWNVFDLGILLIFSVYIALRACSLVVSPAYTHRMTSMAYDTLASAAILLFPRLFAQLDHYPYFSSLLLAFRLMAADLVAVFVLIAIACSGFYIAFTLSFGGDGFHSKSVAMALFQILMGFTPPAWDIWGDLNLLGKALMSIFLVICHFIVVTILVTVLTNSMSNVVKQADLEHQFLFAINTIDALKSDALFSFIPPSNLLGWIFSPLRFFLPFRQFVRINRTLLKITHAPVLFMIFGYERLKASKSQPYQQDDAIEKHRVDHARLPAFVKADDDYGTRAPRRRTSATANSSKDRALEEVLKKRYGTTTSTQKTRTETDQDKRAGTLAVDQWISGVDATSPGEQPRSVLEQLENRRPHLPRSRTTPNVTSLASVMMQSSGHAPAMREPLRTIEDNADLLGFSADDELVTSAAEDDDQKQSTLSSNQSEKENQIPIHTGNIDPTTPHPHHQSVPEPHSLASAISARPPRATSSPSQNPFKRHGHQRDTSLQTIIFKGDSSSTTTSPQRPSPTTKSRPIARRTFSSRPGTAIHTPAHSVGSPRPGWSDKRPTRAVATRPRQSPTTPHARPTAVGPRHVPTNKSAPNLHSMGGTMPRTRLFSDLASDIGDNRVNELQGSRAGMMMMPVSLQTRFMEDAMERRATATAVERQRRTENESTIMGKALLARMEAMEQSFREVLREVRGSSAFTSGSEMELKKKSTDVKKRGKERREVAMRPGNDEWEDYEARSRKEADDNAFPWS